MGFSRMNRRDACLALAGLLAGGLAPGLAAADEFPGRQVTLIVPYEPGNTGDLWARMVAPKLSALWKQPVIVQNMPGASTMIGVAYVMRSKPDGHTLLIGSLSTTMAKLTNANVHFDPQVELAPVLKYLKFKMVLATNAVTYAKAKNLHELVTLSESVPGGIFYGGTGPGTAFNMSAGFVLRGLGVKYSEVNYNGTLPIILALIRNEVQVLENTPAALKGHIADGSIYPIAAFGEERFPELPNVQTVREAGYKGFYPVLWNGVFAPKGTPPRVLDRIAADIHAVSTAPDMKDRIESTFSGFIPQSNPQLFAHEIETETTQWRDFLASIHFTPH
ncbi:tripartite-type tricarboxylate transporter receptor subunit TctC [Paraburkholderia sp. WC7.3g]|uniref:Tripartite tricarboxylate transporter substrate binding protein n=1 Tax=Paraburkholderia podalyriae TaxID=1938811 RepID=A0ABR7PJH8_9BURK|nr:tripartite tricarboxylate transporter substrate binding protein [Paraburkholderia podalyriae]MBC8745958.1 tripartite tricarboxylate transporter substrate binding protein [Paraburkholderia podalyriae]